MRTRHTETAIYRFELREYVTEQLLFRAVLTCMQWHVDDYKGSVEIERVIADVMDLLKSVELIMQGGHRRFFAAMRI